ncbi:hypothetical protein CJF32_00001477 [Rutstroemia sp. NJR-2017a WRK4]|nr:hypothetical protein CJF32_00001477 [Rutstroemia sp. NJR-2017a WRK4]
MKSFTFIVLLLAGTSFAATISTTRAAAAGPAVGAATPRKLSPANPPTSADVTNSITNWATSVNTVNAYLNDPNNQTKLVSAIVFAKDEPVQLATLMKTPQLSKAGLNSGKVLMGNFPSIVSNLQMVQAGVMTTQDATMAINYNRCCTVLPNIGSLWAASTNASKVTTAAAGMMPNLEDQCGAMSCQSAVSGNGGGNGTVMGAAGARR